VSIRDLKGPIYDLIPIRNVLVSVYDKQGLEALIAGLLQINESVKIVSTDETATYIRASLENKYASNVIKTSDYVGIPEMEGGLYKTLHPKIIAGIVGERTNLEHQQFLKETLRDGVYFDMVVANPAPFEEISIKPNAYFEMVRSHIDFGGKTLIEAAAFNFLGCAIVFDPTDYTAILDYIEPAGGYTTLNFRREQAIKAFSFLEMHEAMIARYIAKKDLAEINKSYQIIPKLS
jgi:phosphoribosylaminoimidazolecarboxamide formyltransferase/IMP cyclohydrolase